MKTIGIITIHKINNYGSVLQAYALQQICRQLGYDVEIIDYDFPNEYHRTHEISEISTVQVQKSEPFWIKALFAVALHNQHKHISEFVKKHLNLSEISYASPDHLKNSSPHYDVYITGSDQLWSPRYCKGDPAFMLHFAPDDALKISYAASIGTNDIPVNLADRYKTLLSRYAWLSVREKSGEKIVEGLTGKKVDVVLDPTLLLDSKEWNIIATQKRLVKDRYILCYFLNYSFDAFPYVDDLAEDIRRQTGYKIVRVARPPHKLTFSEEYRIGASPEDFLALVRDAEIVLTTSFHGTAYAVNYGRPLFSIVKDRESSDSRQTNLMLNLGLEKQVISMNDPFPNYKSASYDVESEQNQLERLRCESKRFLIESLKG